MVACGVARAQQAVAAGDAGALQAEIEGQESFGNGRERSGSRRRASPHAHACPASGDSVQASQAQQRQRLVVALLDRRVEDHGRVGAHREPAVLGQFGFELALAPGRVAQRHQHLARAGAGGQGFQHVLGGGHLQAAGDGHGRGVDGFARACRPRRTPARAARSRARSAPGRPGTRARCRVSGRERCSSIFSNSTLRLMSLGLLITRPSAPRSLCSHR